MIYRIICFFLFGSLIIAFLLSFTGIQEVYLGNGFRNWLVYVNGSFSQWSFKIPKVPNVPLISDTKSLVAINEQYGYTVWDLNLDGKIDLTEKLNMFIKGNRDSNIVSGFKGVLNVLVTFFNFLIGIINVLITLINVIIQVIQFVLTMVWCIKDIPQYLGSDFWERWNDEESVWWYRNIEEYIEQICNGEFVG